MAAARLFAAAGDRRTGQEVDRVRANGWRTAAWAVVTLAAVVACAAQPGVGAPARAVAGEGKAASAKASAGPPVRAVVEDIFGVRLTVDQPRFHLEDSGLFTAGKAKPLDELVLWKGAHQILIEPRRLASLERIEGDRPQGGLMRVRLRLRDGDTVEGKVSQDLELRGRTRYGRYVVRLERVRRVTFEF